jgi:hypothetical protein
MLIGVFMNTPFESYFNRLITNNGGESNFVEINNSDDLLGINILMLGDPSSGWGPQVVKVTNVEPSEDSSQFIMKGVAISSHDQSGDNGQMNPGDEFLWYISYDELPFLKILDMSKISLK